MGILFDRLSRGGAAFQGAASRFLDGRAVFAILALLSALLTTVAYFNTTAEFPFGSILRITLGVADPPFQGRFLTYAAARAVSEALSVNLYAVHFLLRVAVIVAALYALRALSQALGYRSGFLFLLFPWSVLFSFAADYHYPTDFAEILFFALMLLLAIKGRWGWLLPVFGLAFLNRESAVLILPFIGLQLLASKKKMPVLLCLASMILLTLGFRFVLLPALINPISLVGHPDKLAHNLNMLKSLPLIFSPLRGDSARWYLWRLLSYSGFLYMIIILMKKQIPLVLRRYMTAVFPFCLLAAVFVGNFEETRVFYPLLPVLIIAGIVFLDQRSAARAVLAVILAAILSVLYYKNGPLLKKESEFSVKAAAFQAGEFYRWQKTLNRFSLRHMKIQGDQAIIDLSSFRRKFYFLDASFQVNPPPDGPVPISCRFTLESGYSHLELFWKEPEGYVTISRNINLEIDRPSIQTEILAKITLRFDRSLEDAPLPEIIWKGFSAPFK